MHCGNLDPHHRSLAKTALHGVTMGVVVPLRERVSDNIAKSG